MRVEEEYADVLQNIESAIVTVFNRNSAVVDRDVVVAVEALINGYARERSGRVAPSVGPPGRARAVYEQCRRICEWRLGRQPLNESEPGEDDPRPGELSVFELILCLKRLRKSVRLWHARGGPQGYLQYVRQFLRESILVDGMRLEFVRCSNITNLKVTKKPLPKLKPVLKAPQWKYRVRLFQRSGNYLQKERRLEQRRRMTPRCSRQAARIANPNPKGILAAELGDYAD